MMRGPSRTDESAVKENYKSMQSPPIMQQEPPGLGISQTLTVGKDQS